MADHEHQVIHQEQSITQGEPVQPDVSHREVLEKGLTTFIDVGRALAEIRDKRLYRVTHGAFEQYSSERRDITRQRVSQLVVAARVAGNITAGQKALQSTMVDNSG